MKIKYEFATEYVEIEVSEEWATILVDLDRPHLTPCHSLADNLVYSARGADVTLNMCRGKVIYQDGEFFTIDLEKVRDEMDSYTLPLLFGSNR